MDSTLTKKQFKQELRDNILPFWMINTPDRANGGFYGGMTIDHVILNDIPRTAVSCTRLLWTFSRAYRFYKKEEYINIAHIAFEYLTSKFWDNDFGGLFWSVDRYGSPVNTRKHHYAQAFGIYGLSEYFQATEEGLSLNLAVQLFELLEKYAYEPKFGGYIEGSNREWTLLEDKRLGESDMNCQKSMNTMLHIMEAYTNLAIVWDSTKVRNQLRDTLDIFTDHIINNAGHFNLFFDNQWESLSDHISYGHDIEGSWLFYEAAEILGNSDALALAREQSLKLANGVILSGINSDGSIIQEATAAEIINPKKEWWSQAEAVIGFYNAYQLSGSLKYLEAAQTSWEYIQDKLIDKQRGGWFKRLLPDGSVDPSSLKFGPWEGPYHESRLCFEMLKRLPE
ncbi:MAG TPA: N-acyl-D-glucosamine 2-epimerase [Anaerolineaceae bacterium]|nr:N-acyl-D-glucosamine 2-epimerase [Anaerolineaceae bacterium]